MEECASNFPFNTNYQFISPSIKFRETRSGPFMTVDLLDFPVAVHAPGPKMFIWVYNGHASHSIERSMQITFHVHKSGGPKTLLHIKQRMECGISKLFFFAFRRHNFCAPKPHLMGL